MMPILLHSKSFVIRLPQFPKSKKPSDIIQRLLNFAESQGFEPRDLLQSTVFKTAAIDRSANSPCGTQKYKRN
jgi:hypothetical protein